MSGTDWSRDEVEATVGDYFAMLREELAGRSVNKSQHNDQLRRVLQGRSKGSVEFKHANVSAVLTVITSGSASANWVSAIESARVRLGAIHDWATERAER